MAVIRKKHSSSSVSAEKSIAGHLQTPEEVRNWSILQGVHQTPIDLFQVANLQGIRVTLEPLEDHQSGYLTRFAGKWIIGLNSLHHPRRQRFTLAHELAHYFLHTKLKENFSDKIFFRDEEKNPMEREANKFAGELLMPEAEFRAQVQSGTRTFDSLAEHFNVSTLAIRVRAKELGYGGHGL